MLLSAMNEFFSTWRSDVRQAIKDVGVLLLCLPAAGLVFLSWKLLAGLVLAAIAAVLLYLLRNVIFWLLAIPFLLLLAVLAFRCLPAAHSGFWTFLAVLFILDRYPAKKSA